MNDERSDDRTHETAGPAGGGFGAAPPPRRLRRSRRDRMIFGVAGGLGDYFDVDPVIFRIGFGVSIFFGGLGFVAYLALAVFVPSEEGDAGGPPPTRGRRIGRAIGIAVIVLVALAGLLALAAIGAFATATGHGVTAAIVVCAAGVVIAAAAFGPGWRWLIVPALALAVGIAGAAAADLRFSGGIGEREYAPVSEAAIPADGYELGIGRLAVDLRDLEWRRDQVVRLDADLGIGELVVGVPQRVCVAASTHAGAGRLDVAGQDSDGVDVDLDTAAGTRATPRLVLDASVDMGEVRVLNSDTADLGARHFGSIEEDDAALQEAAQTACAS